MVRPRRRPRRRGAPRGTAWPFAFLVRPLAASARARAASLARTCASVSSLASLRPVRRRRRGPARCTPPRRWTPRPSAGRRRSWRVWRGRRRRGRARPARSASEWAWATFRQEVRTGRARLVPKSRRRPARSRSGRAKVGSSSPAVRPVPAPGASPIARTPATRRSSGTPEKLIRAWLASGRSAKKGVARHDDDPGLRDQHVALEGRDVEPRREGHPGEQAAAGPGSRWSPAGKCSSRRGEHQVALVPVGRQHVGDVRLDVVAAQVGRGRAHVERAVLGVGGELEQARASRGAPRASPGPSRGAARARGSSRSCPGARPGPSVSRLFDRRQPLTLVAQLAVGRVLEDDDVVLLGQLDQRGDAGPGSSCAGRVLVVGHGVDAA